MPTAWKMTFAAQMLLGARGVQKYALRTFFKFSRAPFDVHEPWQFKLVSNEGGGGIGEVKFPLRQILQ